MRKKMRITYSLRTWGGDKKKCYKGDFFFTYSVVSKHEKKK